LFDPHVRFPPSPITMALKKGKKCKGRTELETSSFSSDMVAIVVESATLRVHQAFVEPNPKLWAQFEPPTLFSAMPDTYPSGCHVLADMKHLSLDVGHILVEWLYSGTYQPRAQDAPPCPSKALKRAFGAYSAAREYDLLALETLAREQISLLVANTSLSTFVKVVQEAYPTTTRKDDWLKECVMSLMKAAIKNDSALTRPEEMGEEVEDAPVANLIVKGLIDACREVVAEVAKAVSETYTTGPVEEQKATVEPASPESRVVPTPPTGDNSQVTSDPVEVIHPDSSQGPEPVKKPELQPTVESQPQPISEPPRDLEPEPCREPKRKEDDDEPWELTTKKSKKDKKKKKSAAVVKEPEPMDELVAEPEPEPEAPVPDKVEDVWDLPLKSKKGKKGKKGKKKEKSEAMAEETEPMAAPEPVPEPEPEPEPVVEAAVPDGIDELTAPAEVKKKKKKKAVSIDSWADLVEEPMEIVEAEEAAVTVVTEVEAEKDPWSFWGVTRSPRQSLS
jgi:hypothetical protein